MAVYTNTQLKEQAIYGSSRLGLYVGDDAENKHQLGQRYYELSNHLGNVLTVITDNKLLKADSFYHAFVLSATDYYPFGLVMEERKFEFSQTQTYRYGFNTQEKTPEIAENTYTAEFWQYDARIGRRWNTDPVVKYNESSYSVFGGNSIWNTDKKGDDWYVSNKQGDDEAKWFENNSEADDFFGQGNYIYLGATMLEDIVVQSNRSLQLQGIVCQNKKRCHPNKIDYERLANTQRIVVAFATSFTWAGTINDVNTAISGEDVLFGQKSDGFFRYAGLIPFVSEIKGLKGAIGSIKSVKVFSACIDFANDYMKAPRVLIEQAGGVVTRYKIKLPEDVRIGFESTKGVEVVSTKGYHEFIEVIYEGKKYIFDNVNRNGILKSEYMEKMLFSGHSFGVNGILYGENFFKQMEKLGDLTKMD